MPWLVPVMGCRRGLTSCVRLSDPAGAQPHRLFHAPLAVVVPSVRDTLQPLHRAGGAVLHLPGTADVRRAWCPADPFPGEALLALLPRPHPLPARSTLQGRRAGAGAPRAALCRAAAHLFRTGAASRGTDSRGRSRVQVRVSQDDSELLALGRRVARTGVAAPGVLLETCCPGLGFGFRSHGWQRNSAGPAQCLILQGPGGCGWSG